MKHANTVFLGSALFLSPLHVAEAQAPAAKSTSQAASYRLMSSVTEIKSVTAQGELFFQQEKATIRDKLKLRTKSSDPNFLAPFKNPPELKSSGGMLAATLNIAYSDITLWSMKDEAPLKAHLRTYNGGPVGPTLRLKAGDFLEVALNNKLPETGHGGHSSAPHSGHDFNVSNLHTHGLHVSPAGNSDNVLLEIKPGQAFRNEIHLPKDHHAGTFWYHAHVHGATAIQVSSGMAGALIVEGALDEIPEIKAAKEEIFVFQQIPHLSSPHDPAIHEVEDFEQCFGPGKWNPGVVAKKWHTTINGQTVPVIEMRPGEVHRWRLIHGGVRENIKPALEQHSLFRIARDGICTGELESDNGGTNAFELVPGNRCDILVKANLIGAEASHDFLLVDNGAPPKDSLQGDPKASNVLAVLRVSGTPLQMALPNPVDLLKCSPFPKIPIPDDKLTGIQVANFSIAFPPGDSPPRFLINGRSFDSTSVRKLSLGASERWELSSSFVNHPFHIHVNPFQVVEILEPSGTSGKLTNILSKPYWCDTILVKQNQKISINMTYADYVGKFVLHCHILDHEDQGMMELVEINP